MKRHVLSVIALFVALTCSSFAYPTGITGRTSNTGVGCGSCHGSSNSSLTTVSVESQSGSFTVAPNSQTIFEYVVDNSTAAKAGANIAVKTTSNGGTNVGTLAPESGSGLSTSGSELVHNSPKTMSGGTVTFEFKWTAPSAPGTYYIQGIANAVNDNGSADTGDKWNWLSPVAITVQEIPEVTVTSPAAMDEFCVGTPHDITWESAVIQNVKIELSDNGGSSWTVLAASVDASLEEWTWNIPASATPGNQYQIRISDAADGDPVDVSGNFTLAGALALNEHPEDVAVCSGENLVLEVDASGANVQYQWRRNGTNLANQTSPILTIMNADADDAGSYDCVMSADCGDDITSNTAVATVKIKPDITLQPQGTTVCEGGTLTLTSEAEGTGLTWTWRHNGSIIAGANESTLVIENVTADDAGAYRAIASGDCMPDDVSQEAVVTVTEGIDITLQPVSQEVCEGSSVTFAVDATGADLMYQWKYNGNDINGANESTFVIAAVSIANAGDYSVVVSSSCGDPLESTIADLTVNSGAIISSQPSNVNTTVGTGFSLEVVAEGDNLEYQWRKDGTDIDGATESMYTVAAATLEDAGDYDCVITAGCGDLTTQVATVTVQQSGNGPVISFSSMVVDFSDVLFGTSTSFKVEVSNVGDATLELTGNTISGDGNSAFDVTEAPMTVLPGESADILIEFAPVFSDGTSLFEAVLNFESNANNADIEIVLEGSATLALASHTEVAFPDTQVDEDSEFTVMITAGERELTITGVSFSGDPVFENGTDLPVMIEAGEQEDIELVFAPTATGDFSGIAMLTVESGGIEQEWPINILLAGKGDVIESVVDPVLMAATAFPNPAPEGLVMLNMAGLESQQVVAEVYDASGKLLSSEQLEWTGSALAVRLPSGSGMYYLKVQTARGPFVRILNK